MSKPKPTIIEYRNYDLSDSFPVIVLTGDIWKISDIPSGVLHFHNCLEIGLCESDSGTIELHHNKYPFEKGDITFIGSDISHTTYSSPGTASKWSYIFIDFEQLLSPYIPLSLFLDRKTYYDFIHTAFSIIKANNNLQIYTYVKDIINAYVNKPSNYKYLIRGLALSLIITTLNLESEHNFKLTPDIGVRKEISLVIAPALDYIRDNYMNDFHIDELAETCHMSPTHFRRIFSQTMNTNPLGYLNRIRIEKASVLLGATEMSVIDISTEVGFRSVSSFNRQFKEILGTSPLKWRNEIAAKKNNSIRKFTGWMIPPQIDNN